MPRIDAADLVLVTLRKASLLSHWIPGLGLRIEQPGRPGLRVAAWPGDPTSTDIEFHPCEFRGLVLQRMQADLVGLAGLIATDGAALHIGHITADGTSVAHQGLVRHEIDRSEIDGATAVLAFATLLDVDVLTTIGLAAGAHPAGGSNGVRIDFSRDEDLRVTMVHSTFATGCSVFEDRVLEVVLGLAATYAAEEVALTVNGWPAPD
jgi:hypothetical protein